MEQIIKRGGQAGISGRFVIGMPHRAVCLCWANVMQKP